MSTASGGDEAGADAAGGAETGADEPGGGEDEAGSVVSGGETRGCKRVLRLISPAAFRSTIAVGRLTVSSAIRTVAGHV